MNNETDPTPPVNVDTDDREYEQSGLYPATGKRFRLFGLLGSLLAIIVFIAIASLALDRMLI